MINNIIGILKAQHKVLQQNLSSVDLLAKTGEPAVSEIMSGLEEFTKNLQGHLTLENGEFYPNLLSAMKEKNMNTVDTENFIGQMKSIEVVVTAFLLQYSNAGAYAGAMNVFEKDLLGIISALNLRIESEELGVYEYWGSFYPAQPTIKR